jgi:peptidoglycan/xylan/chitin deacetylase (PgdA/CDA1 family)
MKHLFTVTAVLLSAAACSSDPGDDGNTGGTGGSTTTTAGTTGTTGGSPTGTGGSAGNPSTAGTGAGTVAGSGGNPTGGAAPTAGSSSTGGSGTAGTSAAGTSAGGTGTGGTGTGGAATGGMPNTGGSGPAATFKCDNLSLKPSTTGVAKPSGAAGGLKVLDWAGFKGAVSFTFDDNRPSQLPNYAALKATGARFTWFVIASSVSVSGYKPTIADGQEIGNHTQTHPQQGSESQTEVTTAENNLKSSFGVPVASMAAPNCGEKWATFAPGQVFQNRGPCAKNAATVSPRDNTDPFKLPAYMPDNNEAAATMSASITAGKWRIFVIHGFDLNDSGTWQPVPIANVTGAMSKAVSDGFWAETMSNVGAYWQGQKLIPEASTTSAMWTLPNKFPPNMCVRITTSGGTVTQKGQTIGWDDHGYYEISLDAGEVTVK